MLFLIKRPRMLFLIKLSLMHNALIQYPTMYEDVDSIPTAVAGKHRFIWPGNHTVSTILYIAPLDASVTISETGDEAPAFSITNPVTSAAGTSRVRSSSPF